MFGQVGVTEVFEIHREKCGGVEHIDESQLVVGLEAVQHSRMVQEAEDVLGDEAPWPTTIILRAARSSSSGPRPSMWRSANSVIPLMHVRIHTRVWELLALGEVTGSPATKRSRATQGRDLRSAFGGHVEHPDYLGEPAQVDRWWDSRRPPLRSARRCGRRAGGNSPRPRWPNGPAFPRRLRSLRFLFFETGPD